MVDYTKWKVIEISDDEDDTHPNIDTASLFRWRHQARCERMAEFEHEKDEFKKKQDDHKQKLSEVKSKIKYAENSDEFSMTDLKKQLADLEVEEVKLKKEAEELTKKEKLMPWNVDTICHEGFSKTVINKPAAKQDKEMSEEEKEEHQRKFVKEHEKFLKQFGMLQKYDDSERFLKEYPHLVCEETANFLVIWCINLEVEEKHQLMKHVAHQCMCMQYILEMSKHLQVDPRACISSFFTRIQVADKEYSDAFKAELDAFKERVKERARIRIENAIKEAEEEERQQRLGPGGLDPVEVFESLPDNLKKCFEARNIELLQQAISEMPEVEARYHMKRCVDSGLWIPDASKKPAGDGNEAVEPGS